MVPPAESANRFEKHIEADKEDQKVVDLLAAVTKLSKSRLKEVMHKGAVWVTRKQATRRVRRADSLLQPGETLHLYYDENVLEQVPPIATLIADKDQYSVWYKPYGMLSQGSKWGDHCAIARWVETHLEPQRPAFIVHRLDRATTGLMLVAHSKSMAAQLARLFQQREVEKVYHAIVHGHFPEVLQLRDPIAGKAAASDARRLAYDDAADHSLVEVAIETGRKHQVRLHLAGAGYPVVGDRLHGSPADPFDVDLQLCCCRLAFQLPGEQERQEFILPDALQLAAGLKRI